MLNRFRSIMRSRSGLLLALVSALFTIAVVLGYWQRVSGSISQGNAGPEIGRVAPDFSVRTPDGETVRLSDYRGKTVLLNFFATWCGPCKEEAPHLKAAYERNRDELVILGVTFQDTAGSVRAFADEYQLPFPLALDD